MNKKVIEISRKLCQIYKLEDFESLKIEEYPKKYSEISSILIKIMFVCMSFDKNEQLANEILISLIPEADIDELVIIFNKITIYNDEFLNYCKMYSKIRPLKPVITKIFKKLQINNEEAYIFTKLEELDEPSIKKLFETINTAEFKKTKGITSKLVEKYKSFLPNLTENGYRNIRQIGKIHIFENEYRFDHPSEIIRIEYFKRVGSFIQIYEFLHFNQFILEPDHRNIVKNLLEKKIGNFRNTDEFSVYIDLLYNGLALRMCKSKNPIRRHLGTILLKIVSEYLKEPIDQEIITNLIYDVSAEIRREATDLRRFVEFDFETHFKNLFTHKYEDIYGACIFLSDLAVESILNEFIKHFKEASNDVENHVNQHTNHLLEKQFCYLNDTETSSSKNTILINETASSSHNTILINETASSSHNTILINETISSSHNTILVNETVSQLNSNTKLVYKDCIYGLMCCLNNMQCVDPVYTDIVDQLYQEHSSLPSKYSWRILKECCVHYKLLEKYDLLMDILLSTDHLGLIILIRDFVDVSKINVKECIEKGINEIFRKKTNARRSGGISQYFTLLIKNRDNYLAVRDRLFEIITDNGTTYNTSAQMNGETVQINEIIDQTTTAYSESTMFHTLNAFISIFDDYSDDQSFYLKLGFFCLQQPSFSIKNCGFALLGSVFKKILISQKSFDNFILSFKKTRQDIVRIMNDALESRNTQTIYFILFIYDNTTNLTYEEMSLILRSEAIGELISLKATDVIRKHLKNISLQAIDNENVSVDTPVDLQDIDLVTFLTALLIDLNCNMPLDSSILNILNERFSIKNSSTEFLIHNVVNIVKSLNVAEKVADSLLMYAKFKYKEEYDQNLYNPEYDFSYILELIKS